MKLSILSAAAAAVLLTTQAFAGPGRRAGGEVASRPELPSAPMGTVCLTQTGFHPLRSPLPLGSGCSGRNHSGKFEIGTVQPAPLPPHPFPPSGDWIVTPPLGHMCQTSTGLHPLRSPRPLGSRCSGTNQWGHFETGTVTESTPSIPWRVLRVRAGGVELGSCHERVMDNILSQFFGMDCVD